MREIRFRWFHKKSGKIADWNTILKECDRLSFLLPSDDWYIMQFTGLKDKNGKEIYEGDIIGRKGFFSKVIEHNGVNLCFYNVNNPYGEKHTITRCSFDDHDEIIGNIYENPDLLK